ncbi:hypothetical protein [Brevundimonas balnearis]|uniref:CopG family transcriptional regulator n=1 Tax=Brevundimonas balnearis TaxID=1572858 RepID=A0ABV6R0U6_9CAUL
MADGALKLTLNDPLASRLTKRADAAGLSPEAFVSEVLARLLDEADRMDRPPTRPEDYEGPYVELEDALGQFSAELDRRLASRG